MKRANGSGGIAKLSGKRRKPYAVTVTKGWDDETARQIRVTLGYYETRKAAREALNEYLQAPIERPRITLHELYEEWSAVKYRNIGSKTIENYRLAWKRMEPLYGVIVKDLRTNHMQKIIDDNSEKSKSYLQKIRILFNLLMKYALQHDIIIKNYAEFIALPKKEDGVRNTFTDIEIRTLFKNDASLWVQTILIFIYTGFRVSEMLSLTRFNVDLENAMLIGGMKTEAGRNRAVPIHPRIMPYITAWTARGGDTLICAPQGGALSAENYRRRYFAPTLERLGIRPLTPHCCRHTCATRMARVGIPPVVIQKFMGHKKYETTANIYTHPDYVALKNAMELLE